MGEPADPDGVCGYIAAMLFDTREKAQAVMKAGVGVGGVAGGGTQGARDWHLYTFWEHILETKTATEEGCPFRCPHVGKHLPKYSARMCAKTEELVFRMGLVGLNPCMPPAYVSQLAGKLSAGLKKAIG